MQTFIRTLILGIAGGSVYALASTGLVLTYKTSGVLNFGYGAVALFTTFIHWQLTAVWGLPIFLSAAIVLLVVAPLIGFFLDGQLFRRIEGQPQIIGVIATVGLFVLFQGLVRLFWGGATRSVPSLFPSGSICLLGHGSSCGGGITIGSDSLGIFAVATAAALALGAMLRYTRVGVAFRAVVDNRSVAGLMGINTGLVSGGSWALGTAFAALTGILLTPQLLLDPNYLPPFIIAFVLGAAVVGYMRSLPLAYAGGLIIGIAQAFVIQYVRSQGLISQLSNALPFLMITGAVIAAPKAIRATGLGASFIVRTREIAERVSDRTRNVTGLAALGFFILLPAFSPQSVSQAVYQGITYAIVFLSLVILTGYSGQISLGHTAFMGISAFTAAHLATDLGAPAWAALVIGTLAAAPAGALIGFVAVRVHGLHLALMTLAFAFMADALFFSQPGFSGGEGGIHLPRPEGFAGENAFYYLVLASLLVCIGVAVNLRTGRTGRILAAMRDSETATRSLGIPVTKYKVLIFAMSAAMAGLGGTLHQMVVQNAGTRDFIPFYSLIYMTLAVLGGIFAVGGAIVSGLLFGLYPLIANLHGLGFLNRIQLILFGLGGTLALANNPEGMYGELRRLGGAVARVNARRRTVGPKPAPITGGER